MLLSAGRAVTLKLANQRDAAVGSPQSTTLRGLPDPTAPVLVERAPWLDFAAATALADPRLDLATPLKGPFRAIPVARPEAAAAALRLAVDKHGYFHIRESNRGDLGDGVINFDLIFDALLDIDYKRDIVFESFSTAVVDEALSLTCAIWRDTWTDNDPLAAHAKRYIELKYDEAKRRRSTNARA